MQGMNKVTGMRLSGVAHLRQSIQDILSTPVGTRVMRPDYGSRLADLIDRSLDDDLLIDFYVAIAEALKRWEPRIELRRVQAFQLTEGRVSITIEGLYLPNKKYIRLEGLEL
jgi:phage baseplate assembly protein W